MRRSKNTPARRMAALVMQAVVCICPVLLSLLIALQLTLFREGHLIHSMDAVGYPDSITQAVRLNCDILAQNSGLPAGVLDPLITTDDTRTALVRRVDVIWHGTSELPATPFANVVAWLEDTMTRNTGIMWTSEDDLAYARLRAGCEDVWRTLTVAPFANVLNILAQYRRVALLAGYLLFIFWVGAIALLVPLSRGWGTLSHALGRAAVGAAFATLAAAAWMGAAAPWHGWMPGEDAASGLFYQWMSALPAALAVCGLMLAAVLLGLALGAFSMAERARRHRTAGRRRAAPKTQTSQSVQKSTASRRLNMNQAHTRPPQDANNSDL